MHDEESVGVDVRLLEFGPIHVLQIGTVDEKAVDLKGAVDVEGSLHVSVNRAVF